MDIGRAFGFVFDDERWVSKVLLGGIMLIIPFAAYGYMLKVARNVAQGNPRPLPEPFENFGDTFMQGLYWFIIRLVYLLPAIILYGLFICVAIGMSSGSSSSNSDAAGAFGGLLSCIILPIYFVLILAGSVVAYAAEARYLTSNNNLSEALKIGEVIGMVRRKPGPWLMLLLVTFLAGIAANLGLIACGIGVLFTAFYAICVQGHALGQTLIQEGMASTPAPGTFDPPPYTPPTF